MKFSELDEKDGPALQPYLDTCLLPVTGLDGGEAPWEMADAAAAAGEWLLPLERAFKGRTVTLPAYHYYDGSPGSAEKLRELCGKLRRSGFRYIIVVCGRPGLLDGMEAADLTFGPASEGHRPDAEALRQAVADLWRRSPVQHGEGKPGQADA